MHLVKVRVYVTFMQVHLKRVDIISRFIPHKDTKKGLKRLDMDFYEYIYIKEATHKLWKQFVYHPDFFVLDWKNILIVWDITLNWIDLPAFLTQTSTIDKLSVLQYWNNQQMSSLIQLSGIISWVICDCKCVLLCTRMTRALSHSIEGFLS